MTRPAWGNIDPLSDWPGFDPQPDRIHEAITDLCLRAHRWDETVADVGVAAGYLGSDRHRGLAADAQRQALGALADAATGVSDALLVVAATLSGYLEAFTRYTERIRAAREEVRTLIEDIRSGPRNGRGSYPFLGSHALSHNDFHYRMIGLAEAALADLEAAGLYAARVIADQAAAMQARSANIGNTCGWLGEFEAAVRYGRDLRALPGGITAVMAGVQLVGRAYAGGELGDQEMLRARAIGTPGAIAMRAGRAQDASPSARAAAGLAQRAGASDVLIARIGAFAAVGEFGLQVALDGQTVLTGAGEGGVHGAVTRTAAGLNAAALVGVGGKLLAGSALEAAGTVMPAVLVATTAYQVGDLVWAHRRGIAAGVSSVFGHRRAKELP